MRDIKQNDIKQQIYAVWLQLACGIASPLVKKLISFYGGLENVYKEHEYAGFDTTSAAFDALIKKDVGEAERIVRLCRARNIEIITCEDKLFPTGIASLRKMPACIYCVGKSEVLSNISAAIVGSREASDIGKRSAFNLAKALSDNGITVVSGMARGIDAAAHLGALKGPAGTVAVFGTAIDNPYPKDNIPLYEQIIKNGCVLSEIPPGMRINKWNFAERNRLISALAHIIMVGESRSGSGALITAKYAGEQGKQVVCLPILPNDGFAGTIALAESGAHVLTGLDDAVALFERDIPRRTAESKARVGFPRQVAFYDGMQTHPDSTSDSNTAVSETETPKTNVKARSTAKTKTKRETKPEIEYQIESESRPEIIPEIIPEIEPETKPETNDTATVSQRILKVLDGQNAMSVNQIIRIMQEDSGRIMAEMTLLELSDKIKRLPGDRYQLN